jgi:outer membrane receptor protein involved in Fe transport
VTTARTVIRRLSCTIVALLLTAGVASAQVDQRLDSNVDESDDSSEYYEEYEDDEATPEDEESRGQGLDEITVTAQKRAQRLQDVPAAVTALTGAQLDESGVTQIQDLAFQVPNLHFGQVEGNAKITIRGVSAAEGSDQSTAFHVDGVLHQPPDRRLFAHVLRCPARRGVARSAGHPIWPQRNRRRDQCHLGTAHARVRDVR